MPTFQDQDTTVIPGVEVDEPRSAALGTESLRALTPSERNAIQADQIGAAMANEANEVFARMKGTDPEAEYTIRRGNLSIDQNASGYAASIPKVDGKIDDRYQDPAITEQAVEQGESFKADYQRLAHLQYKLDQSSENPALTPSEAELQEYQELFEQLITNHMEGFNLSEKDARVMVNINLASEVARAQTASIAIATELVAELGVAEPDMIRVAQLLNGKSKQEIDQIEAAVADIMPRENFPDLQEGESLIYAAFERQLPEDNNRLEELLEKPEDSKELKLAQLERMLEGHDPEKISQEIYEQLALLPDEAILGLKTSGWKTYVGAGLGAALGFYSALGGGDKGRLLTNTGIGMVAGAGAGALHDREYGDTAEAVANLRYLVQGLSTEQIEAIQHSLNDPLNEHIGEIFKAAELTPSSARQQEEYRELIEAQIDSLPAEAVDDRARLAEILNSQQSIGELSIEARSEVLAILAKSLYQERQEQTISSEELETRQMQFQATVRTFSLGLSQQESQGLIDQVDSNIAEWAAQRELLANPDSLDSLYARVATGSSVEEISAHMQEILNARSSEELSNVPSALLTEVRDLSVEDRASKLFEKVTGIYENRTDLDQVALQRDLDQTIQAYLSDLSAEDAQAVRAQLDNHLSEWGAREQDPESFSEIYSHVTASDPRQTTTVFSQLEAGFDADRSAQELLSVHRFTEGFWSKDYDSLSADDKTQLKAEVAERTDVVLLGLNQNQIEQVMHSYSRLLSDASGNDLAEIIGEQVPSDLAPELEKPLRGKSPEEWEIITDSYYARASIGEILARLDIDSQRYVDRDARRLIYQIANNPAEFNARLSPDSDNPISTGELELATTLHRLRYGEEASIAGSWGVRDDDEMAQIQLLESSLTIETGINVVEQTHKLYNSLTDGSSREEVLKILLPEQLAPAERLRFGLALRDQILPQYLTEGEAAILEDFFNEQAPLYLNGMDFADSIWQSVKAIRSTPENARDTQPLLSAIEQNLDLAETEDEKRQVTLETLVILSELSSQDQSLFQTLTNEIGDDQRLAEVGYQLVKHTPEHVGELGRLGASEELISEVKRIIEIEARIKELEQQVAEEQAAG